MPVIKSAKKKLKQDKKRVLANAKFENYMKDAIKEALVAKSAKAVSSAESLIDKAAKKNILHKNKAARLKSRLSKAIAGKAPKKEVATKRKPLTKAATKKARKATSKKTK